MITCHRCGTANQDENQYCGHCGTQLQEPSRSGATITAPEGERPQWVADPVIGLRIRGSLTEFDLPMWAHETTIGRQESCSIVLKSAAVSAIHCSIERQPGGACIVHDRGSKNGILTDGTHRRMFELPPGSLFMVGPIPLVAFSASMQQVRERLQRYLGYDERHQRAVENALDAIGQRRHVLLVTPPGGQAEKLARRIHDSGPGARQPFHIAGRIPSKRTDQRAMFSAAGHGTLVIDTDRLPTDMLVVRECLHSPSFNVRVIAIGQDPARALAADLVEGLGPGHAASVRIPPLADRSEADLLRLISMLSTEISGRIGAPERTPSLYLRALLAHDWGAVARDQPNNLDALEEAIERLLVLERESGNQHAAQRALGITWGAWGRWYKPFRAALDQ